MLFLIRFNNKINMDTLSCEQLMQIIVELDTSYKNEVKNKEFENRCLKGLLDSNEASDQSIEFISGTQCDLCGIKICVYKYRDEDDDDLEDETDVNEVFICKVCNKKTCSDCNWAGCCRDCFQVRRKVIECSGIVDKIKSHSDSS